ncbi:MAG: hypothetical protein FWH20_00520 [Oscillospiraceae bacterium]|nr:hypothetical protein [Oscillospiraceae bacterium]
MQQDTKKTAPDARATANTAAENTDNPGVYSHKFDKPFEYEGESYSVINFKFNKLTGEDLLNIEKEMQDSGEFLLSLETSRGFLHRMASKASGVGSDTLRALPLNEFNKIANAGRRFLLTSGF